MFLRLIKYFSYACYAYMIGRIVKYIYEIVKMLPYRIENEK